MRVGPKKNQKKHGFFNFVFLASPMMYKSTSGAAFLPFHAHATILRVPLWAQG